MTNRQADMFTFMSWDQCHMFYNKSVNKCQNADRHGWWGTKYHLHYLTSKARVVPTPGNCQIFTAETCHFRKLLRYFFFKFSFKGAVLCVQILKTIYWILLFTSKIVTVHELLHFICESLLSLRPLELVSFWSTMIILMWGNTAFSLARIDNISKRNRFKIIKFSPCVITAYLYEILRPMAGKSNKEF